MPALFDISIRITTQMIREALSNQEMYATGHLGTHYDDVGMAFPLSYMRLDGVIFDVSAIRARDILLSDVDVSLLRENTAVLFYTGFVEETGYGSASYFRDHPQLSYPLIDAIAERKAALIGIDAAGIRRGSEHDKADLRLAQSGIFVIENLTGLGDVSRCSGKLTVNTYPMNYEGLTGFPCRVTAERQ